jgi:hypothetical protein
MQQVLFVALYDAIQHLPRLRHRDAERLPHGTRIERRVARRGAFRKSGIQCAQRNDQCRIGTEPARQAMRDIRVGDVPRPSELENPWCPASPPPSSAAPGAEPDVERIQWIARCSAEVAGEILRLSLATLLAPQTQEGVFVVPLDHPGVRAADELSTIRRLRTAEAESWYMPCHVVGGVLDGAGQVGREVGEDPFDIAIVALTAHRPPQAFAQAYFHATSAA